MRTPERGLSGLEARRGLCSSPERAPQTRLLRFRTPRRGLQFKTDGQLTIRKESTGLQYLARSRPISRTPPPPDLLGLAAISPRPPPTSQATAFGEVFLILGRFSVSAAEAALRVPPLVDRALRPVLNTASLDSL